MECLPVYQGNTNSITSDIGGLGRPRQRRGLLFLFKTLLVCVFCWIGFTTSVVAKMRKEPLTISTSSGQYEFEIEVAESEADKAMGLMFRQTLGRRAGMLFAYERPFEITMWMKNTYISLDMIFIRQDGLVHRIAKGTEPFSEAVVASQGDVSAVLEVAAGVADEIGLKAGDKVEHRLFSSK